MPKGHYTRPAPIVRFWRKVDVRWPDECWPWLGARDSKGYGIFQLNGRAEKAYRFMWIITYGRLPKGTGYHGTCIRHRCDNPPCVNPAHLECGSHVDNVKDREIRGRTARGERSGAAKFTEYGIRVIRAALATGRTGASIAREFGVSKSTIARINRGKTWHHVL